MTSVQPAGHQRNGSLQTISSDTAADLGKKMARVLYDYTASTLDEITVRKSEKVEVLDDSRNWWLVKNRMGLHGYMPANLLQMLTHNQSRLDRPGKYLPLDNTRLNLYVCIYTCIVYHAYCMSALHTCTCKQRSLHIQRS